MTDELKLNIEAAVKKDLGELSSFSFQRSDVEDGQFVIGRYENTKDNYFVLTNRSLRLCQFGLTQVIDYSDLCEATVPAFSDNTITELTSDSGETIKTAKYKVDFMRDRTLRQVQLKLSSGEVVSVPVMNDTPFPAPHVSGETVIINGWDIYNAYTFFRRVAFFASKRRRRRSFWGKIAKLIGRS
jgi:hypothetical protein